MKRISTSSFISPSILSPIANCPPPLALHCQLPLFPFPHCFLHTNPNSKPGHILPLALNPQPPPPPHHDIATLRPIYSNSHELSSHTSMLPTQQIRLYMLERLLQMPFQRP